MALTEAEIKEELIRYTQKMVDEYITMLKKDVPETHWPKSPVTATEDFVEFVHS